MTHLPFPPMFVSPSDLKRYVPRRLARQASEPEPPLRAQSVCLARRPQSSRARTPVRPHSERHPQRQFLVDDRPLSRVSRPPEPSPMIPQKKHPPPRIPCSISIKTLSIPMPSELHAHTPPDPRQSRRNRSKPRKQVEKARAGPRARETENRLLIQISEADQVSDFERILNSNAILRERRAVGRDRSPAVRPRSGYSVSQVSDAYHFLFQRHVDSVQRLISDYREGAGAGADGPEPPAGLLGRQRSEELRDLSEFYDDDVSLQEELRAADDRLVDEELRRIDDEEREESPPPATRNFKVNLSGLIVVNGLEPRSPGPRSCDESEDEKEWDAAMSARSEERDESGDSIASLGRNLDALRFEEIADVPTITFSNCCDNNARCDEAASSVAINLTVPAVERSVEARPAA